MKIWLVAACAASLLAIAPVEAQIPTSTPAPAQTVPKPFVIVAMEAFKACAADDKCQKTVERALTVWNNQLDHCRKQPTTGRCRTGLASVERDMRFMLTGEMVAAK